MSSIAAAPSVMLRRWVGVALLGALFVILWLGPELLFRTNYRIDVARLALYMAALATTWSLLAGIAGQFSFAHVAIGGLAGYASALWGRELAGTLWGNVWISMGFGVLFAGVVGLALGLLLLRLRGAYLALFTIAFAEIARLTLIAESEFTGGRLSLAVAALPGGERAHYYAVLAVALVALAAVYGLVHSRFGLFFRALREDDEAAASLGVNVTWVKVLVFTATAVLVGAAASTYFHTTPRLVPEHLDLVLMSLVIAYAVIGGLENPLAAGIAAFGLTFVLESLRRIEIGGLSFQPGVWRFAIFGAVLVLTLRFARNGLLVPVFDYFAGKAERRRETVATREAVEKTEPEVEATAPPAPAPPPSVRRPTIDLQVDGVHMWFGGNQVLDGITFVLGRAEICGLIGPNGAGKTTLTDLLNGVHRPTAGAIYLRGERVDGLAPYEIARRGLGRTFQVSRAFQRMTVMENLLVPARALGRGTSTREMRERAMEALRFLTVEHLANEYARALSGGQQKLLELARLLMLDPDVLILDEPFAGVHPRLKETIFHFIEGLRDQGKAFIVIEHDMDTIFTISQRLLVLAAGGLIADGPPDTVRHDQAVIEAYLGTDEEEEEKPPASVQSGTTGEERYGDA